MLSTNGGRVLGVTSVGKNLKKAIRMGYRGVSKIKFKGMHFRKDIGRKSIYQQYKISSDVD